MDRRKTSKMQPAVDGHTKNVEKVLHVQHIWDKIQRNEPREELKRSEAGRIHQNGWPAGGDDDSPLCVALVHVGAFGKGV